MYGLKVKLHQNVVNLKITQILTNAVCVILDTLIQCTTKASCCDITQKVVSRKLSISQYIKYRCEI